MKTVLILLLGSLSASTTYSEKEDGWFIPQYNNTFIWMSESEVEAVESNLIKYFGAATIKLHLYTNQNPTDSQLIKATIESIRNSNFEPLLPTKIIIHGWQNDHNSDVNTIIREAYFNHSYCNVISVDWSTDSGKINYLLSASRVKGVGEQVAKFIDFLDEKFGVFLNTLEIVGYSLGAHAAGFAGKNVKNGRVGRIIGLDAALPAFSINDPADRLDSGDAVYVEAIHTCADLLGFLEPIGTADFYPNGGRWQPGCGIDIDGACSHSRAYIYYAEAIGYDNFSSAKCDNHNKAVNKECGVIFNSHKMGSSINDDSVVGSFYTPVNSQAPFGIGRSSL